jgi:hypothetical protein
MAAIKLLLGIVCLAVTYSVGVPERNLLRYMRGASQDQRRSSLVKLAENEIGVRELTGNNDGKRVELYLAWVGLKRGEPWCAAFISYLFHQIGNNKPRSGWSPDLFPDSRLARSALPGNIIGIYFADKHRIAHVGLIIHEKDNWITSVEGNTNITGGREGDGVYRKLRHRRTIYKISDWLTEGGKVK